MSGTPPGDLVEVAGGVVEVLREPPLVVGLAHHVQPERLPVHGHSGQCGASGRDARGTIQLVHELLGHEAVVPGGVSEREPIDVEQVQSVHELVGLDAEPGLLVQSLELCETLLEPYARAVGRLTVDGENHRHPIVGGGIEQIEIFVADLHRNLVHDRLVEQHLRQLGRRRLRRLRGGVQRHLRQLGRRRLRRLGEVSNGTSDSSGGDGSDGEVSNGTSDSSGGDGSDAPGEVSSAAAGDGHQADGHTDCQLTEGQSHRSTSSGGASGRPPTLVEPRGATGRSVRKRTSTCVRLRA